MLYKLSIKPTRLELLKLISLDKSRYKEIRVAVRPLPFRFNRGIIDSDDFFQQFVDIVNDFLETYRQDITELFVSLKENYFQVYEIGMQEYNEELLHWEIVQYLTDDFSNYKFGSIFVPESQKVHLVIARTKLIDYFQKVFKAIYGTINFTAIGYDLKSTKTETVFIKTDQEITDYYRFGYSSSWNPENDIVAPQKSYKKHLIAFSSVAAVALVVLLFNIFTAGSDQKPGETSSQSTISKTESKTQSAPKTDTAQNGDTIKPANTTVSNIPAATVQAEAQTQSSTDIYTLLQAITPGNLKSIVINKNYGIIEYASAQDADQSLNRLKSQKMIAGLKISGRNKNLLSFNITASDFYQTGAQNQQLFRQLSDKLKLSAKYNYRLFNNPAALTPFIAELQKNKLHFSHLVISRRGNLISMAVDFN